MTSKSGVTPILFQVARDTIPIEKGLPEQPFSLAE